MRRCHNALELAKDFRESKGMFHSLLILNFLLVGSTKLSSFT